MISEKELTEAIVAECNKLILRYEKYHNSLSAELNRAEKRTGISQLKVVRKPDYWAVDRRFNPFYCRGKAKAIAKSIVRKILDKSYSPEAPHEKSIPKPSGGIRVLRIYQIPDAVVSKIIYERLLKKNRHRFSAFSYAYRDDRNVHYAIQDMYADLMQYERIYLAEYDFSDFFGNICHVHLMSQLRSNGLMISDEDLWLIKCFLLPDKGIPQGTSISLFLANVACLSLDKSLERIGVKFARYADDTVICSNSYESICKSVECLENFSISSGVNLNMKKSAAIHLLINDVSKAEIRAKTSFDFLGYSVGSRSLAIKKTSVQRIKKQISYLLYCNLIQPLRHGVLRSIHIPAGKDRDFLTAMMQIRRYICGGLLKSELHEYLARGGGEIYLRGVMSFYPLVTDEDQLRSLDGWLTATIYRVLKLRAKLFASYRYARVGRTFPYNVSRQNFIPALDARKIKRKALLEIPSFLLVKKAMQKAMLEHGISYVMDPRSSLYAYNNS